MAEKPKIDAELHALPDGTEFLVFEDIPLEWFADETASAAIKLAEARAYAKRDGRKVEN